MRGNETPTGLIFAREDLRAWDEARALITKNHEETGALPTSDFAPSFPHYQAMERAGVLRVFTLRARVTRELAGYAIFLVGPHHDYPAVLFATQSVLYVAPAFRGLEALRFMRWQDDVLLEGGMQVIMRSACKRNDYGPVLERMGYKAEETRYIKDLRQAAAAPQISDKIDLDLVAAELGLPRPSCPTCGHRKEAA